MTQARRLEDEELSRVAKRAKVVAESAADEAQDEDEEMESPPTDQPGASDLYLDTVGCCGSHSSYS